SMYPPMQGVMLAVGELLGNPWIGVLLACAAMVAVVYWMLLAWLPARWAMLGGIVVWLKFCFTSYWINSYLGGAIGAAGGALLLGSLARILRKPRTRDALLFAFGLAILANSRPYEGFLFSLPAVLFLLWWLFRSAVSRFGVRELAKGILLPVVAVLLATAGAICISNPNLTRNVFFFSATLHPPH